MRITGAIILALSLCPSVASATAVDCADRLRPDEKASSHGETRSPNTKDLIEVRYIGSLNDFPDGAAYSVSPDERSVAVMARRADVASNSYCSGIFLVEPGRQIRLLTAHPGVLYWKNDQFWGTADWDTGGIKIVTPRWSPDGKSVAYLKPEGQRFQLWIVGTDGSAPRPLVQATSDVTEFRFADDGRSIIYSTQGLEQSYRDRAEEGLKGWRYDRRFIPMFTQHPRPVAPDAPPVFRVDLATGEIATAAPDEAKLLPAGNEATPDVDAMVETLADGSTRVALRGVEGAIPCEADSCARPVGQPWSASDGSVVFLKREGPGRSRSTLYAWRRGDAPQPIMSTEDLLEDCGPIEADIICARESATRPRYLVGIDRRTGKSVDILDLNPRMSELTFGRVERRHWINEAGIQSFGDLVYPVGYRPGQRYPLVVVQYDSRGYLSGGTGDEFPIQLFASRGFMVLSIQRPDSPYYHRTDLGSYERQALQLKDFVERRSIVSSIETEVRTLIKAGLVDPDRVGITGLSDGTTTIQYAVLHGDLFKAAASAGCCWDPSQNFLQGEVLTGVLHQIGWPKQGENEAFWNDISLSRRAADVNLPILIQAADTEYLAALESYTALAQAGKSIEMFVFPGEGHIKRQPAHRDAIYRRNLAWFDFWFNNREDKSLISPAEYEEWRKMRGRRYVIAK